MFDMQLFLLLEADPQHSSTSKELTIAVVSWLVMRNIGAAHAAWQRHSQLTLQMTAEQQQEVFHAALSMLQKQPDAMAVAMAKDCCLLAASLGLPRSSKQLQQLIDTLLADHRTHEAYIVSHDDIVGNLYLFLPTCLCKTVSLALRVELHHVSVCVHVTVQFRVHNARISVVYCTQSSNEAIFSMLCTCSVRDCLNRCFMFILPFLNNRICCAVL